MTNEQYAADLRVMYAADRKHFREALKNGETVNANGFEAAMRNSLRELKRIGHSL